MADVREAFRVSKMGKKLIASRAVRLQYGKETACKWSTQGCKWYVMSRYMIEKAKERP
jgi:hypothetical protein